MPEACLNLGPQTQAMFVTHMAALGTPMMRHSHTPAGLLDVRTRPVSSVNAIFKAEMHTSYLPLCPEWLRGPMGPLLAMCGY